MAGICVSGVTATPAHAGVEPGGHLVVQSDDLSVDHATQASETERTGAWWSDVARVLLPRDYNTRIVLFGTLLLGISGGTVGGLMLLRKRSLMGDVVGHAALPGVAIAFIAAEVLAPGTGKSLPVLLSGAFVSGGIGMLCVLAIGRLTRIKNDAALAIVLSVFFGLGVALLTAIQKMPSGNSAGLQYFIYGQAASLIAADVKVIAGASLVVLLLCAVLFKEYKLLCFDEEFAAVQGWPTVALDLSLTGLVVGVVVIGLQSVGALLVVAMLIIPPASARFWARQMLPLTLISAGLGGLSAAIGVLVSARYPHVAAGAVIVLAGTCLFLISMLLGSSRGVVRRVWTHFQLQRRIGRHDLLRAFYECLEQDSATTPTLGSTTIEHEPVSTARLASARSWTRARLGRLLKAAVRDGCMRRSTSDHYRLTTRGATLAWRAARNHRLWEIFLITCADIAPSRVDRDADRIEHVLEPALIAELEGQLARDYPAMAMPSSPHPLDASYGLGDMRDDR